MAIGSLIKVKSIAESFCNTFDLHKAIIGLKNNFWSSLEWPFYTGFTVLDNKDKNRNDLWKLQQ